MARSTSSNGVNGAPLACAIRSAIVLVAIAALLSPALFAQTADKNISASALNQIQALMRDKESRTLVQQKIDSQLIYEFRMQRGQAVAEGVPTLQTIVKFDAQKRALVEITGHVTDSLLSQIQAVGGEVHNSLPGSDSVLAAVPLNSLEQVASFNGVRFVAPKGDYMTQGNLSALHAGLPRMRPFALNTARLRTAIAAALGSASNVQAIPGGTGVGSQSSEGDETHRAVDARNTFHVDGTGLKIGVLSDGVTSLAASQALGDLGPVTVLPGQSGSGDEGTAMLEIIHDLAPGAQLFFATADPTITQFAQNIHDLRFTYHCDIIVDDVFYFDESAFQDGAPGPTQKNGGAVIQAVKDVTADGALYFSSAGNEGNVLQGTAGVWEGNFKDGGAGSSPIPTTVHVHDFGTGNLFNTETAAGVAITLQWSDPLGASSNDYDLYVLNSTGTTLLAASTNIQSGTQDPIERINGGLAGARLVVAQKAGAAQRYLSLNTLRGTLQFATTGQTHGHSAVDSVGAYGVSATPAAVPFGSSTVGPYPNAFSSSNQTETFTSDGKRRIFFQGNGTPYTPGNFLATGGRLLSKPDITAADGVAVTGVGGFPNPFYGTSAAAPHAAAIAALVKQAFPAQTQTQFRTLLTLTATDIFTFGFDVNSGSGIINAFKALLVGGAPGTADIEPGTITAVENPGDGDGAISAGEGGKLTVTLRNVGTKSATKITATLTSPTPGVTVYIPNTDTYPDLLPLVGSSTQTYLFTLATNLPCPDAIDFTLTVNYTGGTSPKVITFKVPTGSVPISVNTTLDGTAPPASAFYTAATGLQTGRISRPGIVGTCSNTPQPFLGYIDNGSPNRRYDAYGFKTCSNAVQSCVTVSYTSSNANVANLLGNSYVGGPYNPADVAQNFWATNSSASSFSFLLPGGPQNFTAVVHEVSPGGAVGANYNMTVSGACINSCVINHPPVAKAKDVTVTSGFGCVASANINDGSFDPDPGDTITITQTPAGPYPVGVTPVILTVTDSKGAFSQATANVTVLAASQSSLSAVVVYVPPVKARITLTDLVYASCAKVAPTGTVTFTDLLSNTILGSVPLNSSGKFGQATLTIERVRPVNMSVKASYSGDANTAGSSAGPKLIVAH